MDILLSRLLVAVAWVLGQLLWFYGVILFVRVIASWLNPDPRNGIMQFLYAAPATGGSAKSSAATPVRNCLVISFDKVWMRDWIFMPAR